MSRVRWQVLFLVPLAVALLGLLAAACGTSSSEGVAQVGPTGTSTTGSEQAGNSSSPDPAAFSACMRSNGLPDFPDPDSDGRIRVRGGFGPDSPQWKAAWRTCRRLAPTQETPSPAQQAEEREQLLEYSACMRNHGITKFPDPKFNPDGSGGILIDADSGIDTDSPQFKEAEKACEELAPGRGESQSGPVPQP